MTSSAPRASRSFLLRRAAQLLDLIRWLCRFNRLEGATATFPLQREADIEALAVSLGLLDPLGGSAPLRRPAREGRGTR